MVKLEFFPESNSPIKPNRSYKQRYLAKDPLLNMLLMEKQNFGAIQVVEPISLADLLVDKLILKPLSFPKKEILGEEFTDEDYRLLCAKLAHQHEQFRNHQLRDVKDKIERIKMKFIRLTYEEIFTGLKIFDFNEDETTMYLTKNEFIAQIRNQIAQIRSRDVSRYAGSAKNVTSSSECIDALQEVSLSDADGISSDATSEDENDTEFHVKNRRKKTTNSIVSSVNSTKTVKKKETQLQQSAVKRLKLDDALANSEDMEGWSEARIRAYQGMKKSPNAYFYRFNAPGETQKNGPWTKEEDELFMRRLADVGADGQWGIFSKAISGRVGYQCSNYYRKLIETGRIKDVNYRVDERGKAHYIGGKTRATGKRIEHEDDESSAESQNEDDQSEDCELDEVENISESNFESVPSKASEHKSNMTASEIPRSQYYENPLPGFIDAITRTELVRPAISPYGHVLSYETWIRCLLNGDRKNTCPLTNQPLHKRQLIFLTSENIEMYRDRIRQDK